MGSESSVPDHDKQIEPADLSPTEQSSSLARLIEYQFLAELLQEAWFGRNMLIDVLYSSVDAFGYDLVLESGDIIRHVQLKTRAHSGTASEYALQLRLRDRPAGCVVWIGHRRREGTNRLDLEYRFFGAGPREKLPDLGDVPVFHSRRNKDGERVPRPGLRKVKLTAFDNVDGIASLLTRLFGPADG